MKKYAISLTKKLLKPSRLMGVIGDDWITNGHFMIRRTRCNNAALVKAGADDVLAAWAGRRFGGVSVVDGRKILTGHKSATVAVRHNHWSYMGHPMLIGAGASEKEDIVTCVQSVYWIGLRLNQLRLMTASKESAIYGYDGDELVIVISPMSGPDQVPAWTATT